MRFPRSTVSLVVLGLCGISALLCAVPVPGYAFSDSFDTGFTNWTLFGSPSPRLVPFFGGRTNVFDNNGDANCDSGMVTNDLFTFSRGAVITSDVYLQVTNWGGCWGSAELSLTRDQSPYAVSGCAGEGFYDGVSIGLVGIGDACWATPAEYRRHAYVQCSILAEDGSSEGNGYAFPADSYINGWHTLKVVIGADRYVKFYIDDTLVYQTTKQLDSTVLQNKRIHVGRRSSGSIGKAYHDAITIAALEDASPALPVSGVPVLMPSTGTGFQGIEAPFEEDQTAYLQRQDGTWAPPAGLVPFPYFATGEDYRFWDALSLKFDTNAYSPAQYSAVLRFYAQKGEYWNTQWNHYVVLKGDRNVTYQDQDLVPSVLSDPRVHSIRDSSGGWFEEALPADYWNSGSFWVTLRMWNMRIDAVELQLTPLSAPSAPTTAAAPLPITSAMFRRNPRHTGDYTPVSGGIIPDDRIRWEFVTGYSFESPTAVDGTVYVADLSPRLYALDARTGTRKWDVTVHSATPAPAVKDGTVYVSDFGLYALSASTGQQIWVFPREGTGVPRFYPPTVIDGTVYVGSAANTVYAIDAGTGTQKWAFPTQGGVESSPAIADGVVYVGCSDHNIYALDALSGTRRWTFTTGAQVISSPAIAYGTVYVGSGDGTFYALDAQSGTRRWTFTTGDSILSSPAVVEGTIYVGSGDDTLYALDAQNGVRKWSFTTGGWVISSPAVADGVVYVGSSDGKLYAIDSKSGVPRWTFSAQEAIESSPVVMDGVVYVGGGESKFLAIGTGSRTPTIPLRAPLAATILPPAYLPATAVVSGVGLAAAGAALQGVNGPIGSSGGSSPPGSLGRLSVQIGRLQEFFAKLFGFRAIAVAGMKETRYRGLEPEARPPLFLGFSGREWGVIGVSVALFAGAFLLAGRLQIDRQAIPPFLVMGAFAIIVHELVTDRLARYHAIRTEFQFWGLGTGILFANAAIFGLAFGKPSRTLMKGLETLRPRDEMLIMMVGPLVNVLFAVLSFVLMSFEGLLGMAGSVGFPINILLAVYSLLPFSPMKGKVVYSYNRLIWALVFFPVLALYAVVYLLP